MKKTIFTFMAFSLLFLLAPQQSNAKETIGTKAVNETSVIQIAEAKADINKISIRLEEISRMDVESMSKTEKKELKKELRNIKNELRTYSKSDSEAVAEAAAIAANSNGLYISGGALIIILLLIILL